MTAEKRLRQKADYQLRYRAKYPERAASAHRRVVERNRAITRPYVETLRATTPCAGCGAVGYIEYHSVKHRNSPNARVNKRIARGQRLSTVLAEIARCMPLCKACHNRADRGKLNVPTTEPLD